LIDYENNLRVA